MKKYLKILLLTTSNFSVKSCTWSFKFWISAVSATLDDGLWVGVVGRTLGETADPGVYCGLRASTNSVYQMIEINYKNKPDIQYYDVFC